MVEAAACAEDDNLIRFKVLHDLADIAYKDIITKRTRKGSWTEDKVYFNNTKWTLFFIFFRNPSFPDSGEKAQNAQASLRR